MDQTRQTPDSIPKSTDIGRMSEEIQRLSLVASKTTNSVVICDSSGFIEWINEGFSVLTGYTAEEALGKKPGAFLQGPQTNESTLTAIRESLNKQEAINCDIINYHKDGHQYWINLVITPILQDNKLDGFIGIQTDINERKRADELLSQAQRMDAIGQLVGGVAHDFNNILGILTGNLELLKLQLEKPEPDPQKYLEKAFHACSRASGLTQKLLQFSQFKVSESRQVRINSVIHNLAQLLTKSLTQNIELILKLETELWPVWCNQEDLEDALLNLVINARDAMQGNGRVEIATENVFLENQICWDEQTLSVKTGHYAKLSIWDTGPGIPQDILGRVFEPFFSTKGGQGSGLGLSMVYGFVKRSNGHILINSSRDAGTCIAIWLPKSTFVDDIEPTIIKPRSPLTSNKKKVLLVDDEKELLAVVHEQLNSIGCNVLATSNPVEAQKLLLQHKDINLLITDEVMPGVIKGHTLAKTAMNTLPDMSCIIMSGYNLQLGAMASKVSVLAKPFTSEDLLSLVNSHLNA